MKLLFLTKPDQAFDILGEYAGLFGDNGADPDGDAYLRDTDYFPQDVIEAVCNAGVARVVEGEEGDYPPHYHHIPPVDADRWCGYQVDRTVYYTK